jgi:hypothetical protein
MIATTIRSSIRENPSSRRGMELIPSPRHTRGKHWCLNALHTSPDTIARFMPRPPHIAQTPGLENKEFAVLLATNPTRGRRAVHALWTKIVAGQYSGGAQAPLALTPKTARTESQGDGKPYFPEPRKLQCMPPTAITQGVFSAGTSTSIPRRSADT